MGMNSMNVKQANQDSVLRYILTKETETKNSISQALGLSIPTVTACLKSLEGMGLVRETGTKESDGGRKAMSYCCIKDAKFAIGVDITPNHVNVIVINLAIEKVHFQRQNLRLYDNDESYEELRQCIENGIDESGIDREAILGMGVSLPAIIDRTGKKIFGLHESMQLGFDVYDRIAEWFDFPVVLRNDANCAAQAELRQQPEDKDVIYFYISQSVGGAIISHHELVLGEQQRAGEFGHVTLHPGGRPCFCGRKGCANSYLSTSLLADQADGNLMNFFAGLDEKEEYKKLWEEYMRDLALSLHNILNIFDQKIIIGGYLGEYIGKYMPKLQAIVEEQDHYLQGHHFMDVSTLTYEAAAIGAGEIFIESYLRSLSKK